MIIIAGLGIGIVWGLIYVRRRGGSGLDMAQYAAVWGIIGTLLGIVISIGLAGYL